MMSSLTQLDAQIKMFLFSMKKSFCKTLSVNNKNCDFEKNKQNVKIKTPVLKSCLNATD